MLVDFQKAKSYNILKTKSRSGFKNFGVVRGERGEFTLFNLDINDANNNYDACLQKWELNENGKKLFNQLL